MEDPYGLAVGVLFVLVYAVNRYNTPATNRSSTTSMRYHSSLLMYVAASLILFFFLAQLVQLSPAVVALILPSEMTELLKKVPAGAAATEGFSYFLFAALCLTILLPKTPGLKQVDGFIRVGFQKFGAIPYQVHRLSSDLRAGFHLPAAQEARFTTDVSAYGLDPNRLLSAPRTEFAAAWVQAYSVRLSLAELESEPRYAGFFTEFADRWRDLDQRLEAAAGRAVGILKVDTAARPASDPTVMAALEAYRAGVAAELKELLARVRLMVARAVLACERTKAARKSRIRALGFELEDATGVRVNYDRMALLLVGLASLIAVTALASVQLQRVDSGLVLNLRHAIQITIVVWAAVLWAVLVKKMSWWQRSVTGAGRPYGTYALAGLLAVMTQVIVYVTIKVMVESPQAVSEHLPRTIPWMPLVFATSFVLSWQCDCAAGAGRRLREALIQGAVMALTAWVAFQIIQVHPIYAPTDGANHELWSYVFGGGVLGLVIGWLTPTWYRADNNGVHAKVGESDFDFAHRTAEAF